MALDVFRNSLRQTIENGIFFDNASMGPVAPQVTRAITECMELRQTMPMKYYQYAAHVFPTCKSMLADLIGASPAEIAFTENVTYGINSAAWAMPLERGDNVILCDREFASNVYPWLGLQQRKGVEARIVPNENGGLTTRLLDRYADERTRAVSVSSVQFSDGHRTDLEAIGQWCRTHRAYLVVDCAQSLGVMPMDVKKSGIDFMAGLSSKWMLGPFSTGFLYVRKELIPDLLPPFLGADSVKGDVGSTEYRLDLKDDASRFEPALPNAPGVAGLVASLELMEQVGVRKIQEEAWRVSGYFIRSLRELGLELAPCALSDETRSTIVSFRVPRLGETYQHLRQKGIACSMRGEYIRTGIHGYNTTDEVDQVISVLKKFLK